MSYPYGKRERLKIVWEDACKSNKIRLVKASVVFEGSQKHCAEQMIRWLIQKDFIDPFSIFVLAGKVDFRLYGKLYRMMSSAENFEQKARTHVSEDSSI